MQDLHPLPYHTKTIEQTTVALGSDIHLGLSADEAKRRLAHYGPNQLIQAKGAGLFSILLNQFKNVMVLILLVAAAISALTHDITDAIVILVISIINAGIGFMQEYKADRAMAALTRLAEPQSRLIREGKVMEVPSAHVVPGDVILLEAGSRTAADARVVETAVLKMEEAALTGESLPVEKQVNPIEEEAPLAERSNTVFMGTTCVYGRGKAIVTATGMNTELGRIAHSIQEIEQVETPLQKRLSQVAWILVLAGIGICIFIFMAGSLKGIPLKDMLITAIALAVASIPESLPAVITIVLAMGLQQMVRKKALVKSLPAVEALGSVTVICSDKTGTLTQNEMTVKEIYCKDRLYLVEGAGYSPFGEIRLNDHAVEVSDDLKRLLTAACLCNDATLFEEVTDGKRRWRITGDPTEGALLTLAGKAGLWKGDLEKRFPRVAELPFDSERKLMTTIHRLSNGQSISYTKGALDHLLGRCKDLAFQEGSILEMNQRLAHMGRRILAFAYKDLSAMGPSPDVENIEQGLIFLGMVGMVDPPREEARGAVRLCLSAGIKPIMITGDHPATAAAIATELEIMKPGDLLLTGSDLKKTAPQDLEGKIERISTFARVSPEDKIKIVRALQGRGHVVSMTGDGVNDAPALKGADIGVAMGITGTEVSKEAADMVLLDDNFATIVTAVSEGRRIYDNIRKFIRYMLGTNAGEVLTMFGGITLNMPLPLLPIQILWINLITDSLPALALSMEPAERDVMKRPPRPPSEGLFAKGLWREIVLAGALMAIGCLWIFQWALTRGGLANWEMTQTIARSMVFVAMAFYQLFNALAVRSDQQSIFSLRPSSNWNLYGAVLLAGILQLAVIYLPPFQKIFGTAALTGLDLLISMAVASSILWVVELQKAFRRSSSKEGRGLFWFLRQR